MLKSLVLLLPLLGAFAQLPKNGGLTDERPSYENPEDAVYKLVEPKLRTPWTEAVAAKPETAWEEYPRPQLRRDEWLNLNGVWEFQTAANREEVSDVPVNQTLNQRILVPFCIESGLSGIAIQSVDSWYRTTFEVPEAFGNNTVVLHFGAVDHEATVFVNGEEVGKHVGGWDKFAFDITSYLQDGANELILFVHDPTDGHGENPPVGKQRTEPSHIFYTPCSGIWQTVSIESVPSGDFITNVDIRSSADGTVNATISTSEADASSPVKIEIHDRADITQVIFSAEGTANEFFTFTVDPLPELWSPESPNLYDITITVGNDVVKSYTGFRTVERKVVDGVQRFVLNGKPVYQFGPLDQGYWPDGLMSPPSYEAMVFDVEYLKDLGFNFLRKHIKVEPDLFYWATDKLGIMVMQDMPSMEAVPNDADQAEWERQMDIMVKSHLSFPSILSFVIYNEGWGQQDSGPEIYLTPHLQSILAGHQLINSVSGWHDHHFRRSGLNIGDFHDNHHYSTPQCGSPFISLPGVPYNNERIGFQGEFGGVGVNTTIEHLWNDERAIREIDQTYEIDANVEIWNYRALRVIEELREQTELFDCNGGVYTQTTDVEGEVNGFLTYDRAEDHVDHEKWKAAIQALYDTFEAKLAAAKRQ